MKYNLPKKNGECFFHPAREDVPQLLEANHFLLESYDFEIGGTSFRKMRRSLREKIARQAKRLASGSFRAVVAAHQPGFHGPGILYKYGVLQSLSGDNIAVNFVVDSDLCKDVSVEIPYLSGKTVGLREVVIFPNQHGLVFEKLSVPPKEEVDRSYTEIERLLKSLGDKTILSAFCEFREVHERVYVEGESAADILTAYRRGYCPTPDVHENSISAISNTEEFLSYACGIIERIEDFHEAYNSSLEEYRQLHGIRSGANPFPNLLRDGELWELPFWGLDSFGRRRRLFAGGKPPPKAGFVVGQGGSTRITPVSPEKIASLRLRPRAVCLTMFLRLFVGDLFVHGVGGGNYDQVTDKIIEKYYNVSPPGYVVCSRTKFLSGGETATLKQKMDELRGKIRRMRHNPERFVPGGDALAKQAERILCRSRGKPSAEHHLRLKQIRRSLLERLGAQISLIENELAETERQLGRFAALHRRDLPYFLYPPFML